MVHLLGSTGAMRETIFVILLVTVVHHVISQPPPICPVESPCDCRYITSLAGIKQFVLKCKNLQLVRFPAIAAPGRVDVADFSDNRMKRIRKNDVAGLICEELNLRNNLLLGIQKEALASLGDSLKELDISKNNFKFVPVAAIRHLKVLEYLNIASDLKPGQIDRVPSRAFFALKTLKTLILSGHKLYTINPQAFAGIENSLDTLDLSNVMLKYFPVALRKLKMLTELSLRNSGDFKIPSKAFNGMKSLLRLDLSQNNLGKKNALQVDSFLGIHTTLEELNLRDCQLTELPETVRFLLKLKRLDLYGNKLIRIRSDAFVSLNSLSELNLGGQSANFTAEIFRGVSDTLTILKLSTASLRSLPAGTMEALPMLQEIDLSKNMFTEIPTNFSAGSNVLKYNLDYNEISKISKLAFIKPPSGAFIELSLKATRLRSVSFAGNPCFFSKIDFSRNRFPCGCNLYRLVSSGVKVIGNCNHKRSPIRIDEPRFENYYSRKCKSSRYDCKASVKSEGPVTPTAAPETPEFEPKPSPEIVIYSTMSVAAKTDNAAERLANVTDMAPAMETETSAETTPPDMWPDTVDVIMKEMMQTTTAMTEGMETTTAMTEGMETTAATGSDMMDNETPTPEITPPPAAEPTAMMSIPVVVVTEDKSKMTPKESDGKMATSVSPDRETMTPSAEPDVMMAATPEMTSPKMEDKTMMISSEAEIMIAATPEVMTKREKPKYTMITSAQPESMIAESTKIIASPSVEERTMKMESAVTTKPMRGTSERKNRRKSTRRNKGKKTSKKSQKLPKSDEEPLDTVMDKQPGDKDETDRNKISKEGMYKPDVESKGKKEGNSQFIEIGSVTPDPTVNVAVVEEEPRNVAAVDRPRDNAVRKSGSVLALMVCTLVGLVIVL